MIDLGTVLLVAYGSISSTSEGASEYVTAHYRGERSGIVFPSLDALDFTS